MIFCLDGQADKLLFPVLQSLFLSRNKISQVRKCKVFSLYWFIIKLCSWLMQYFWKYSGRLIKQRAKGLAKLFVRFNKVWLYPGSFPYILLFLGWRKSFVIPRTLLYRGLLYRGSTVYKVGSYKNTLKPKGTNDINSWWPTRTKAKNLI